MLQRLLTVTVARAVRVVLALASAAVLARLVGADGLGQWSMIVAAAALLHAAFLNWTQVMLVRFGGEERAATGRLDATYAMRWPFLLCGFTLAFLLLWWQPFDWPFRIFGLTGRAPWLVAGYLAGIWLMAELHSLMQVDGRFKQIAFVPALAEVVTLCFLCAAVIAFQFDAATVMTGMVAIVVAAAGIAFYREFRRLHLTQHRVDARRLALGAQFAWPLVPNFVIGYVSDWSDHLVLRLFFSAREVGLFQGAYQLLLVLLSLSAPIITVLLPRLIGRNVTDATVGRRYVQDVVPTLVILWLPLAALCTAVAPSLLLIMYGSTFAPSAPVLAVLCIALPGGVLTTLYGMLYTLQGRLHRTTLYHAWMAGINVACSLALVPVIGVLGAAVGTSVSYLVSQWLYVRDQHRHLAVPSATVGGLFGASVLFALIEGFALDAIVPRLLAALGFIAVVIVMARHLEIVNGGILARLFVDRFSSLATLLTKVLVPQTAR